MKRRTLLISTLGAVGAGALVWGGSAAMCQLGRREAALARPLYAALADLPGAERIGRHWLQEQGAERIRAAFVGRTDLVGVALLPGPEGRRAELGALVRREFARNDVVLAGPFVVSATEALIAGLREIDRVPV